MANAPKLLALVGLLAGCQSSGDEITGGFDEHVIDDAIRQGQDLELVDIDKDGDLDIVAAFNLTDAVHLYLSPGNFDDPWERLAISGERTIVATSLATGDFDGDGDVDVAAAGAFDRSAGERSPGELVWYANPGDPRGVWQTKPIANQVYGLRTLLGADLDGDGKRDLLTGAIQTDIFVTTGTITRTASVSGGVSWWKNEGSGFFGPLVIDPVINEVSSILVTDLDHDDRLDVVAAGRSVPPELVFYRRTETSTPTFVRYQLAGEVGIISSILSLETDPPALLAAIAHPTYCSVERLQATGAPGDPWTSTSIVPAVGSGGTERPLLTAGDFDGDGKTDFGVTTGGSSGHLRVYLDRSTSFEEVDVRSGYRGLTGLAAADFDRDGKHELVTLTSGFGTNDRLAVWQNVR